jgi:hypothetical protein
MSPDMRKRRLSVVFIKDIQQGYLVVDEKPFYGWL